MAPAGVRSVCTSSSAPGYAGGRSRSPASRDEAMAMQQRLRGIGGDFRADILRERIAKEEENLRQSGYVEASVDLQIERDGGVVNGRLHVSRGLRLQVQFQGELKLDIKRCAKRSPLRPHERSTMIKSLRASRRSKTCIKRAGTSDPRSAPRTLNSPRSTPKRKRSNVRSCGSAGPTEAKSKSGGESSAKIASKRQVPADPATDCGAIARVSAPRLSHQGWSDRALRIRPRGRDPQAP